MKCSLIKSSLALFLIILSFSSSTLLQTASNLSTESSHNLNYELIFNENEAKFFSKFAKNANCAEKPLSQSCPHCLVENSSYKFFFYFQTTRMKKFNYKLMIHYSDIQKRILITIAGPSVQENHKYIKFIYAKGFSLIKIHRINIEKEFALIYFGKLRGLLQKKIGEIKISGRGGYRFIFNGYSIGGSLATLAAFDLSKRNIVKHPQVFTYGSLRIGDATFVALVNSEIKVWRIVKSTDYIVRIPTCYFAPSLNSWRCFTQTIIKKFIVQKTFPLRLYVRSYVTLYKKNNPVLKKALIVVRHKVKQIAQKKKLKKNVKKVHKKINKKVGKKVGKNVQKKIYKNFVKNLQKKVIKKSPNINKKNKTLPNDSKKKEITKAKPKVALKKAMKKIRKAVKSSTVKKLEKKLTNKKVLKKLQKVPAKKIKAAIKKTVLAKVKKSIKKKLTKKVQGNAATLTKAQKAKAAVALKKKTELAKKKAAELAKRVAAKVKNIKKLKILKKLKKDPVKHTTKKEKLSKKSDSPIKKQVVSPIKKVYTPLSTGKDNKLNNKTKANTPVHKKVSKVAHPSKRGATKNIKPVAKTPPTPPQPTSGSTTVTYATYVPTITTITTVQRYTPVQIYFNFIYYTQPIGYEIYYDDEMTSYQTCQYFNGVSVCEKNAELPLSFTIDSHKKYYGENFDQCSLY